MPPPREKNLAVLQARALRRQMTLPEGMLWQVLRQRPEGLKFRREHPIGWYIADFYCAAERVVIEIDGISRGMGDRPAQDARRGQWLQSRGVRVLRFAAAEVMHDLQSVVTAINLACRR
jgi:very-short-patch-repair endonuclease